MDLLKVILIGALVFALLFFVLYGFGVWEMLTQGPPTGTAAVRATSGSYELTERKQLDEILSGARGKAAVFVYAPGCPWCTQMKPIIDAVSTGPTPIYRYNTQKLADREQLVKWTIRAVPMILAWDSQGRVRQHAGDRTAESVKSFLDSL